MAQAIETSPPAESAAPEAVIARVVLPGRVVLQSGDRMDRATFHALYEQAPEGFKAELIRGRVYVALPLSYDHGGSHFDLVTWLGTYRAMTPGVTGLDNATTYLGDQSEPQPDGCLIIEPERGGQTRREGKYVAGSPELILEVAVSSRSIDLHDKYADYEAAGVREYLVYLVAERQVRWFVRRGERFEPLAPGADGPYRSEVFPGLWLDPAALARGDMGAVLRRLNEGLASPEHADFVARLAAGVDGP